MASQQMTVYKEYTEGRTRFLAADVDYYSPRKGQPTARMPVFYNPRMQLNRDLSVLILAAVAARSRLEILCEPLAGCGVRTLRYMNECQSDFHTVMFDANPSAVATIRSNVAHYGLEPRTKVILGDAKMLLMSESRERRFDFIDIDPFGSPAPYLSSAIQSIRPGGGLLALTATDMPVLCGVYPQVAFRKYGGLSVRSPFCKEAAVRLVIGLAFRVAGMNDLSVQPLASLSHNHYVRVWLWIREDRGRANRDANKIGVLRFCPMCMQVDAVTVRELADMPSLQHQTEKCSGRVSYIGPLWIGGLYDEGTLTSAMSALPHYEYLNNELWDLVGTMNEEQHLTDRPYVDLHSLCGAYRLMPPRTRDLMNALTQLGHRVTKTHFSPTAIRTDASVRDLVTVMKQMKGAN